MSYLVQKLTEKFTRFPGIGPRQARRFVYFLLTEEKASLDELARLIQELPSEISQCSSCFRFAPLAKQTACELCSSGSRANGTLMILARDADLEAVEKSRAYSGRYFVLGGTISPLEKNPARAVRLEQLEARLKRETFSEIILALGANAEGDYTMLILKERLQQIPGCPPLSTLGRGLSTGTELEYSDYDTIENALKNRRSDS